MVEEKTQSDTLEEAYYDRNQAVMLAAKLAQMQGYDTGWRVDPDEPHWPILFIELPSGQVSWHIPMEEALDHGVDIEGRTTGPVWDGHTLNGKRHRILVFVQGQ
jgi:hypothetical protein